MNDLQNNEMDGTNEKTLYVSINYILIFMAGITLSQILTVDFIRGIVEITLAIASYFANQRSRSEMIKNVTLIAMVVLLLMGIYDISIAFGWL